MPLLNERAAAGPTLRIVAINDVYTLDNLPRLRTLVEHYASHDPADVLLVTLAGDFVSPSILSSLDAGRGMVDCLNAVGVTHVCLGNHEDDIPTEALRQRIRELHATLLNTNAHGFTPNAPAHQVIEVGHAAGRRVRVGLVGVVMKDESVYRRIPFGAQSIEPANEAALREAARLLGRDSPERCACVIPLTHQTIEEDRELARAQPAGLRWPVILGGHEHVLSVEKIVLGAPGEAPELATWIVKAGADAVRAVIVDLAWPLDAPSAGMPDLPLASIRVDPVANYPEDASLRARVDGHMLRVRDLEAATLMTLVAGQTLSSIDTRARQTSLGSLVCSRVRDALGAEGCVFNGGGIRASREYRTHFTYGDLKAEVPFENEVVVVSLPGSVVRDAVAASRAHAPAESGGFLQVDDGMIVEGPAHLLTHLDGAPIELGRNYRIALVRDLLTGMDHIEPLRRFGQDHPEAIPPAGSGREIKMVLVDAFSVALWRLLGGFDHVDSNHDGLVTADEVAAAVARVTTEAPSAITAELVMHALDSNHDHAISRDEAAAVAAPPKRPRGA